MRASLPPHALPLAVGLGRAGGRWDVPRYRRGATLFSPFCAMYLGAHRARYNTRGQSQRVKPSAREGRADTPAVSPVPRQMGLSCQACRNRSPLGAPSPSSLTRMPARRRSPRSSSSIPAASRPPAPLRERAAQSMRSRTGWTSRRSAASRSRLRCCSSPTTVPASTSWTPRVTRTSRRTPTAPSWRPTPQSW